MHLKATGPGSASRICVLTGQSIHICVTHSLCTCTYMYMYNVRSQEGRHLYRGASTYTCTCIASL